MKRVFLVTLLTLFVIAPIALSAQTTVTKFNQDGEFASVSLSPDQNSSINLSVSRNSSNGPNATSTASISYAAFTFDFANNLLTVTQIVGTIPAGDFTGQSVQSLSVNFSTADLDPTTSFTQTCVIDLTNTANTTCGDIAPGTISLTFTQNGISRTRVLALGEEITIGNFTTRIHQRSDNSTANVSGTIFGTSVSGGGATVGINHNTSLEFVKN